AVKFTAAGKRIVVRVRAEGEDAVLAIEDQGVGIPRESLDAIFEMFAQGETPIDRPHAGLGIGLTLARLLAEAHGGTLSAASEGPGRGSVFTLRLPRTELPAAPVPDLAQLPPSGVRRRVLIVEDNEDAREMLRLLLQVQGHEVFEAADGAEA